MEIRSRDFYVYHHIHDKKVFYVGMGWGIRAFDLSDPSRSKRWKEVVSSIPNRDFVVKVVKTFSIRDEALNFEKAEIERLKPVGNTHGISKPWNWKRVERSMYKIKKMPPMDCRTAGALGAAITNKKLTTEMRKKAAALGWARRKAKAK